MRICIVGDPDDLTAVLLTWTARQRGFDVIELRERSLGFDWWYVIDDCLPENGCFVINNQRLPFKNCSGLFTRLNPSPGIIDSLEFDGPARAFYVTERRASIQLLLNEIPVPVVNRSLGGRSNASKPYQMKSLRAYGFCVPEWIVTNDPREVRQFSDGWADGCIYKSCSGLRSRVRTLDAQLFERLEAGSVPVLVQRYIDGRDIRIHTVGREAFVTEARGIGVDSRFDAPRQEYSAAEAPASILSLCDAAAAAERLPLAGFDFRVTSGGKWYCLEINPVPTFMPYQMATGQPIADAILDYFTATQAST